MVPETAAGADCELPWSPTEARSRCTLLGASGEVEDNRERRRATLESVSDGEYCVEVVYTDGWGNQDPEVARFVDAQLIDTVLDPGCDPAALVDISPQQPTNACPAGAYVIRVDDSLGGAARVLAILRDVMLIELDNELRFLVKAGADPPSCWRMIWHPPWTLAPPSRGSTPARPARNKRGRR